MQFFFFFLNSFDDDEWIVFCYLIDRWSPVAGRGGRAGIQGDLFAVPRGGRESELRVHRACGGGTWAAAGWPGAVLRGSRTHAASLKGAPREPD